MIGGTIIAGTTPAKVLFRAIGPSLTNFGIANALQDPTLELHDGQGNIVATNDNWIVRRSGNSTGVAVVEAYQLQEVTELHRL
jgi:hypothetical protein